MPTYRKIWIQNLNKKKLSLCLFYFYISIMNIEERYKLNKDSKVGVECICPSCKTKFIKNNYQQAFCKSKSGTKCKDKYWNTIDPKKRCNTTRVSPASARYMAQQMDIRGTVKRRFTSEGYEIIHGVAYDEFGEAVYNFDQYEDDHPFSSDALGQW
jgi:hypothetical protein